MFPYVFYIIAFTFCPLYLWAEDCFHLKKDIIPKSEQIDKEITENNSIIPLNFESPISGFGISGTVKKYSPDYSIRVVLKDKKGNEYLVLELYEELNTNEVISFKNYCEETLILENIVPDTIKIFLKDASIHINSFSSVEATRDLKKLKSDKTTIFKEQIRAKIDLINSYNIKNGRPWVAAETELSTIPYEARKTVLGVPNNKSLNGLEFYAGGIFIVGHNHVIRNSSSNYDPFVDKFDWRNRHGKNWITSIKHQGWTHYCTAFAALGCAEALTRLYYNNAGFNIDLSEQQIASCSDTYPHAFNQGLSYGTVLDYICQNRVYDELAYPLDTLYDIYNIPQCESSVIEPNEWIKVSSNETIHNYMHRIKRALISKGPLISGYPDHAMALVGYNKIKSGDTIRWYNPYVQGLSGFYTIPDSLIGSTYWIFKNSYGTSTGNNGYYYIIFNDMRGENGDVYISNMCGSFALGLPISTKNYNDDDIIIEDADGDGLYYWGIGGKPQSCPSWIPDIEDGDDSDKTLGLMDEYGMLSEIVKRETWTITTSVEYPYMGSTNYGDIVIGNGGKFSITGSLCNIGSVSIFVESGGELIVDGGILANADIHLSPLCSVTVKNGGIIYMRKNCSFEAPVGCIVNIESGEIRGPYLKKSSKWCN